MNASVSFIAALVSAAIFITTASLIVLMVLLFKDWKGKRLW